MNRIRLHTGTLALAALTLFGCKKEAEVDPVSVSQDITNVSYGSDTAQRTDVYLPAGRDTGNTKVIVFIHGGSWTSGDKSDFTENIRSVRTLLPDYAFFNINYRLALNPANRYPAQVDDLQKLMAFVQAQAAGYHINARKVVLVGASAGAHLALLYGYKFNSDRRIRAVIDLFGPTDLTDMYINHPFRQEADLVIANFMGTTPQLNPTLYHDASPINYVSTQTVPTKIFHGALDSIVPIAQSYRLRDTLLSLGVKVDATIYPNQSHGWYDTPTLTDTYARIVAFIKENVQ